MKNSKLIGLLSTFSKSEMKQFLLWLKSPVHNDSKVLIQLFEEISKFYPDFKEENIEVKTVFKKLYPHKEFVDDLMRKNISNLYNQCLEFITWQDYNQQKNMNGKFLFNALLQKQQYKELIFELKTAESLNKKEKISVDSILQSIDITYYKSKVVFNLSEKKGKQKNDEKNKMYRESIQAKLDAFFIDYISYYLIYMSYARVYGFTIENGKEEMLEALYQQTDKSNYFIKIYYRLYLLQSDYSPQNLTEIFQLINSHYQSIAPLDMHNILNILINTINDHFNFDSLEDERYRLQVYKILTIPSILFAKNPVLNSILYSNIVLTYINLKEYEKVNEFINNYTKYLDKELQNPYKSLALARFYFAQKDYENAQTYLLKTDNLEPHLRLRTRLMLIEVYYHKSEFGLLFSLIASTTKQLKRDKFLFNAKTRKSIFSFLLNMNKLGLIKQFPNKKSADKLKSR